MTKQSNQSARARDALQLGRSVLSKPFLKSITHSQRGTPCTLRNLWVSFDPATKLRAELPDKGRVLVLCDRKAVDPSLTLNPGCLLFHLIAHLALPGRAGVSLLGESHVRRPRLITQPIDECEMHHACLRIDLVATPAPIGRQSTVVTYAGHWRR
jgi:hypothetical protein